MAPPQFLELLASGEEGRLVLGLMGITPEELPLTQVFSSSRARLAEHRLASTVAAATEHLQIVAPVGGTARTVFAFRHGDTCAVFRVGADDTLGHTCTVAEAAVLLDETIECLMGAHVDWSVAWHSDDAMHQVDVNPDGTVQGEPQVSLEELLTAFAA
ncbi:hypothetical protein GCM10025789_05490 [Tessaracoccus lubricantis]|uniref:Histidine kinase n=1 Tax=Tessaracoccus lubricantis TaxID=545543 RepID=A0ABP9F3T1_9ACTN